MVRTMWPKPRIQPETERTVYVLSDDDPSLAPARVTTSAKPPAAAAASPVPMAEAERWAKRWLFHAIAIALALGYFYFLFCFWAPAPSRPGIDENAYLLGGRMIAEHGSPSYKPPHTLSFVGSMWVLSGKTGIYYPKYPAGLPLLYAILIWTAGPMGREACFLLSPACAALAAYFTFLLARRITGSFYAVLAMIVMATGITTLQLAEEPNSHAACLCFVTAGMYFLVRFVQTGRTRWGIIAGFLLGYAVTIRYSEGLNLLTLVAAVLVAFHRPRGWRGWIKLAAPLMAWGIPVGILALFNWMTLGHFSGYGTTHEATGFTWAEFNHKWAFAVDQLNEYGLFFVGPVGIVGSILMFRRQWGVALLLMLWFVPGWLLYFSYYWGDRAPGVGYLRFFLDLFPPVVVAAFWLVGEAGKAMALDRPRRGSIALPLGAGILCAIPAAVAMRASIPEIDRQHVGNLNLAYSAQRLIADLHHPKARPVIIADEGMFPMFLMYAQFMVDADFYATDAFIPRFGGGFSFLALAGPKKDDSPVLVQKERLDLMEKYYKSRSGKDLIREQHAIMSDALDHNRPVYLMLTSDQLKGSDYKSRFITPPFQAKEIDYWKEPAGNPVTPEHWDLAPPSWRMNLIIRWTPQAYHLFQITRSAPATAPATQHSKE